MSKRVLTDAGIYFGGYDLSGNMNACELNTGADAVDFTAFGAAARNYQAGLLTSVFSGAGFFEAPAPDAPLAGDVSAAAADGVLIVSTPAAVGATAYMLKALIAEYGFGASVGDALAMNLAVGARDRHVRGQIAALSTLSASGASAGVQLGALTGSQRLWAAAMTTAAPGGTTPTLDLTVESDGADDFASATTRASFTQMTGRAQEMISDDGAVTDDWWRFAWTVGGTTPSFPIVAAFGVVTI